jgi:hypothetical protein
MAFQAITLARVGLVKGARMEIGSLLAEQRATGDAFRLTEKKVLDLRRALGARDLGEQARHQWEAELSSGLAQMARLGHRMLELDKSVAVSNADKRTGRPVS